MKSKPDSDGHYQVPNGLHYNIRYRDGVLHALVTPRFFKWENPELIEWVWIVDMKRYATTDEILHFYKKH